MSATNASPDKRTVELVARQLGISESFVEKDWYVTQALSVIAKIDHSGFQLVFSGGTALSKAHKLIQRFSEDIDFLIVAPDEIQNRKSRSALKNEIAKALRKGGFQIEDKQIRAQNENRFIAVDLNYETNFTRAHSLRPHVQIEMTVKALQLPSVKKSVSSLVAELTGGPAEVGLIHCLDPVENAADKLSALTWRVLDRKRGDPSDDPALVRHIYDLAMLENVALKSATFPSLIAACMRNDAGRFKNNAQFFDLTMPEKFNRLLTALATDPEYEKEYDRFVKGVSYSSEDSTPDYEDAVEAIRKIVVRIAKD